MNRDLTRQLAVVLTFVLTLIFNGMATTGALGGTPTADISNAYPIAFVPANVTFSIWGVIYTGLLLFVIYQALPAQRENPILRRIGWLFVLSGVANALWLVLFQYELFVASVPVMLILLVTLIAIYQQTGIRQPVVSRGTRWLVQVPFSIYLGWITVATIANIAQALYAEGYETLFGIGGPEWAAIMLVVATGIVAAVVYRGRGNIAYALTIVWAFLGLIIKHGDTPVIAITAGVMIAVVLGVLIFSLWTHRPRNGEHIQRSALAAS